MFFKNQIASKKRPFGKLLASVDRRQGPRFSVSQYECGQQSHLRFGRSNMVAGTCMWCGESQPEHRDAE